MSNTYKKAMNRIEVPATLLEKTAAQMHEAQKAPSPRPRFAIVGTKGLMYSGALAACLAIFILALPVLQNLTQGDIILTSLTEGELVREVEVKEGTLVFDEAPLALALEFNFGLWAVEKQIWGIERYIEFLGADPRPSALPEGFTAAAQEATVYVLSTGEVTADELFLRYERESDSAWIEVYVSSKRLPAHALSEAEPNSEIHRAPLFAGYTDSGNQLRAQFVTADIGYAVLSGEISQAEFIRFLYQFFSS